MITPFERRRHKDVAEALDVHVSTQGGFRLAGTLQLDEAGDQRMSASFAYDLAYLEHTEAFPLDPVNMPLGDAALQTSSPLVGLGAIFDCAPDAWGRRVVQASLPPTEGSAVYRQAFLRGADGIGALVLTPRAAREERQDIEKLVAWSQADRPSLSELPQAVAAAKLLEEGVDLDESARHMLAGSWTIGGARPKSIMRDDRFGARAGSSVIVKFESLAGGGWRNRLEWVSLQVAALAGMRVPANELVKTSEAGQAALILERFDRGESGRRHYLSAASLVSTQPTSPHLDSRRDVAFFSWKRLLDVTSAVAAVSPAKARVEMFARLALNAALHNTDDHLKNFGFLKLPGDPVHYEIAPVFDVSPQAAAQHYLWCGSAGRVFTLDDALACAREVGIAASAASSVRDRIMSALEHRHRLYDQAGLSARQVQTAEAWILAGTPDAPQPRSGQGRVAAERMRG